MRCFTGGKATGLILSLSGDVSQGHTACSHKAPSPFPSLLSRPNWVTCCLLPRKPIRFSVTGIVFREETGLQKSLLEGKASILSFTFVSQDGVSLAMIS